MSLAALTQVCAEITGKPLPEEGFADGTVDAYRTVVEMVTIRAPTVWRHRRKSCARRSPAASMC